MKELAKIETAMSVALPGGVWTRKGFVVFDAATEAMLCRSVQQMHSLNLSSAWALGDLGLAIQERKQKEFTERAAELRLQLNDIGGEENAPKRNKLIGEIEELESQRTHEYTRELAEVLGVDDGYWRNCVSLARFYPMSHRNDALTPKHHIAAMLGAGGAKGKLATAEEWIAQATRDALSASELRKRVNLSRATAKPPKAAAEQNPFVKLDAADQWAIANKAMSVAPEHRAALRVRFAALIAWLRKLED